MDILLPWLTKDNENPPNTPFLKGEISFPFKGEKVSPFSKGGRGGI